MSTRNIATDLSSDNHQELVKPSQPQGIDTIDDDWICLSTTRCDVMELAGHPQILKVNGLDANNIASFAKEHNLADLILTLVSLVEGPEGVSACTRNESGDRHYLVCGTSYGDICYDLNRHGDDLTVWLSMKEYEMLLTYITDQDRSLHR
jgi:hypothetical protein